MELSPARIEKSAPTTTSEQYLGSLATRSFLSLWSYPRLFRDQPVGKEICDLLVVFRSDVVIFSDKYCALKETGQLNLDWERWYRKAIRKSAEQIWGAERWIRQNPQRIFLDQECKQRFPLEIPADARIHRIAIAQGAEASIQKRGQAGLIIDPSIVGDNHGGGKCAPFRVGQLDPERGFVHVFDREALTAVLKTVDTVRDFISYLRDKEEVVLSGKLRWAWSEQDLLAAYLCNPNEERSFAIPKGYRSLHVRKGNWDAFQRSALRKIQIQANRISYYWDALIENYSKHVLEGTLHEDTASHSIPENERVLRILASESRTKRRELSRLLIEFIANREAGYRTIFAPENTAILEKPPETPNTILEGSGTIYVFGARPPELALPADEQAGLRKIDLAHYCIALKSRYPLIAEAVGISVEKGNFDPSSNILLHIDMRNWCAEQEEAGRKIQRERRFATNLEFKNSVVSDFPPIGPIPRNPRNKPCFCGSGLKFKKCCGADL